MYYNCIKVNTNNQKTYTTLQNTLYTQYTYFKTTQVLAQLSPNFQPALKPNKSTSNTTKKTLKQHVTKLQYNTKSFYTKHNPVFKMCKYKPTTQIIQKANNWF